MDNLIKNDVLILMALPMESQGLFEAANIPIHYCGIGKVNATFKTTELILQTGCKTILNLGTAGSHKFPTHSLVECSAFVQRDMDITALGFPMGETPMEENKALQGRLTGTTLYPHLKKAVCGTGDSFESGPPKLNCDIVDMEAYAMAKVCAKLKVNFVSIKYITDGSDHNAHKDWIENVKIGAGVLLDFTQRYYL